MVLITHNVAHLALGAHAPDFSAIDLAGTVWTPSKLKGAGPSGAVVGFTCNHCPYVQAYEERLMALASEYGPRGFAFLMLNPNAANPAYAEDGVDRMRARAKARGFNFAYAADADQAAARAFGAACTPEFFLFDGAGRLVYSGRIDDEMDPAKVRNRWLADAMEALAAGRPVPTQTSHPIGCSIKWLPGAGGA